MYVSAGKSNPCVHYELLGQRAEENEYTGSVLFTRGNGEEEESSLFGYCTHDERIDVHFEWYIVLNTPNGVREHHAVLRNSE